MKDEGLDVLYNSRVDKTFKGVKDDLKLDDRHFIDIFNIEKKALETDINWELKWDSFHPAFKG